MHGATTQTKEREAQAAYERWIQAELSGDSRSTMVRILYNDIRDYGDVRPETWDYFDLQEMTGGAESMDTQHITELEGEYDPATDEIVATTAGSERVTYDSFTVSGVQRAHERAAQNPDFGFQVIRDQIFHDNFHGPIKAMFRGQTDYDTVVYVSTFADDVIEELGDRGRLLLKELAYDEENEKGFIYGYRKNKQTGNMEGFAMRMANGNRKYFGAYLQKRGKTAQDLAGLSSHEYGRMVILMNTGDTPMQDVAKAEATVFDQAAEELTGKPHHYGREQEGIDAYEIFKQTPNLWKAYRQYHRHLAEHLNSLPLHDDLYDYLVTLHATTGGHVLTDYEHSRLGHQLDNNKITADMALACKKLLTYSHYATLNGKLDEYRRTGVVTDIDGGDIMQSYGGEAGSEGATAAASGQTFGDCETTYGEPATNAATDMAARLGISVEEALRRMHQKQERWSQGNCRNCERDTQIWAEEDGGCNVCRKCANEHTVWGQQGLDRERRRAQAERETTERLTTLDAEMDEYLETPEEEKASQGATRFMAGEHQTLVRQLTVGGAKNVWVSTATGQAVDDDQA